MGEESMYSCVSTKNIVPNLIKYICVAAKIAYGDVSNHLANLSTVAVLPVDRHVPIDKFAMELEHALSAICDDVLHLNSDAIKRRLGQSALDR